MNTNSNFQNRQTKPFGNYITNYPGNTMNYSNKKVTGITDSEKAELVATLQKMYGLKINDSIINIFSKHFVTTEILLNLVEKQDLKDMGLYVGVRTVIWYWIQQYRSSS
tara:strand:+ start:109 stop:435 length:327 start_codon:yes stop_codon:yes gene_type:complete